MIVLVDAGNARLKWAQLESSQLQAFAQVDLAADPAAAVAALAAAVDRPQRVLVSNVAGAAAAQLLRDAFEQHHGITVEFAATTAQFGGVTCGYTDPARLGVDRWLAVIAAHRQWPGSACVVDAGTALTVDAVDQGGTHYGGLILPGLGLMADSLHQGTSDVASAGAAATVPDGLELFGRNTAEAVTRAALLASAALVDRCVQQMAHVLRDVPRLVVTGGDGETLRPWLESTSQFDPHLVLQGLACLVEGRDPESA